MSKKIATFKDLDTLANLNIGTSAGYITEATDEQCVSKGNFDTVSTKTIAATGNGLMFVEGSESSNYASNRLILLDDVQYISEITAVLVSAPNIPAKGGSSYATWKLTQSYKANGDASPSIIEWNVTGSVVEASSKGTTISTVTNVANSTTTVTKNGKSITLSQMIKQDLNKMVSLSGTTSTFSYDSKVGAGGGSVSPTLNGNGGTVTFSSNSTLAASSCEGYTYTRTWSATNSGLWTLNTSNGKMTATSKGTNISNETSSMTVTSTGTCKVVNPASVGGDTLTKSATATAKASQLGNYVTKVEPKPSSGTAHVKYADISAGGTTSSPQGTGAGLYTFSSGSTTTDSSSSPSFGGSASYTRTYVEKANSDASNAFSVATTGTVTTSHRGTTPGAARSVTVTSTLVLKYTHDTGMSAPNASVSGTLVNDVVVTQLENKITSYGSWTTPTVTVEPNSFVAAGGTATITISGDSTRTNTWSSSSKSTDTATKSGKSASFATVSDDYKTLTVGVNTTGSNRTGNVYVDWSFGGSVVKSVTSNSYSQVGQSDCTMTLTGSTKVYHETASIIGKASVAGTIYWGTSQTSMTESKSVSANTNTTITTRTSLGTTTIYAYFVPTDKNYKTLGSASSYHTSAAAKITQATDAIISVNTSNTTYNGSAQTVVTCDPTNGTHGVSTWALGYATSSSATANSGVTWIADKTNLSLTNAGTYYIWRRWTADGNHSNSNSGEKIDATVTISKKAATVTAGSTSKTYDGTALTYKNATLSGQVSGHTLNSYTCTGSITNVGSVNNVPSNAKIYSGTTDVTSNYSITYKNGTLTVSNATFTVSAPNQTYTYNGSAQGAAITVSGLKGSQTATIKYGTTSGTYDTTTVPKITNANEDKTIYWQVTASNHATQTGSYTITMNQANGTGSVTMSGWTYGGTVTNPSPSSSTNGTSNVTYTWYNSSKTQLSAKPTSTSSVGTYYVKATFAATTNYKAYTTDYVSFTISNATFTVSAPNQTYTYNGSAQGAAITVSGLKGSQTATIKYGTTSGTYDTTTTPKITNANEDKTIYWQVTAPNHAPQTGSYTITMNKANGSCTVSLDDWTYGSPKNPSASSTTNSGASVTYTYYKSDQTTSLGATKPTNVGTYYVTATFAATTNYNACTSSKDKFVISQRTVTITAPTKTDRTYNGSAQTIFAAGSCTTGGTMYYSDTNKTFSTSTWTTSLPYTQKTTAGTYTLYYYCYVSDTSNNTGTGINTIKSVSAVIGKKATTAPTLTAGSKTTYDGSAVYAKAASASGNPAGKIYYGASSGATTYNISVTAGSTTASNLSSMGRTDVGTTTIYAFFRPTDTTNYADSSVVSTTAKVTNKTTGYLTATTTDRTYSGSAQTIATKATNSGTYYFGLGSSTTSAPSSWGSANTALSATTAGTYYVWAKCDASTNYNAVAAKYIGTATIGKKSVTVTAGSDSKTYDGTALTKNSATASGLVSGHTLSSYSVTGSITNAGSVNNVPSNAVIKSGTTDVTSNYSITYKNGTLTINKKAATVTAGSTSKTYDGTALTYKNATASGLVSGHTLSSYSVTGSITNVGSANNVPSNAVIKSGTTDVTSNYSITYKNGTLTITKAPGSVTVSRKNPTYTGSAVTIATATATGNYYLGIGSSSTAPSSWTKNASLTATSAGTYYVWAKCDEGTNHNAVSAYYVGTATINNAPGSGTITMSGWTYGGTVTNPTVTSNPNNASVSYTWYNSSKTQLSSKPGSTSTAGTYYVKATFAAVTNYNAYTTDYVSFTIDKAPGTITFSPANKSVQCKNSSTQMTAADVVTCTSATGATGTITYTLNTGNTTLSNCSLSGTKLTVPKDTAVGDYTISITANSAATTNYTSASQTSTFTLSVVADTLNLDYSGTLSIDSSADLSAGADERTITWGGVYRTWKNGGGTYYITGNATLTQSCNNNTDNSFVSLDNTSYSNSSSTTTSTLTKSSYSSYPSTGATFTYTLTLRGVTIKTLTVNTEANIPTTTDTGITAYGTPTISVGSGLTPAGGSATVTCTVKNTMGTKTVFPSGYTGTGTKQVDGSASWSISSQSCAGGGTRYTKSGNTLAHTTMGTNEGVDTYSLLAKNDDDSSKTKGIGGAVTNYKKHTLESVGLSFNPQPAEATSGVTQEAIVTYNTSYVWLSGSSGSTTSGNTATTLTGGTTFSKTFAVYNNPSGAASLDTSTGQVTWNTANTGTQSRAIAVTCTGTLNSFGLITNATSSVTGASQKPGSSVPTYTISVSFINANCVANCQYQVESYTVTNSTSNGMLGTETYNSSQQTIVIYAKNSSSSSKTISATFSGGGGTVTYSPSSGSATVPAYNNQFYPYISVTLERNASYNMSGALRISLG